VSLDPTVMYKPKLVEDKLSKSKIEGSSNNKAVPAGRTTLFTIVKVFEAEAVGLSSINKLTVAADVSCVLVTKIDPRLLTLDPGAISCTVTPVEPVMLWYFVIAIYYTSKNITYSKTTASSVDGVATTSLSSAPVTGNIIKSPPYSLPIGCGVPPVSPIEIVT